LWLLNGNLVPDARLPLLAASLGASERQRYERFLRPQRAREFLLGRLLLRHAAQEMLGVPHHQIVITERDDKAPVLALPASCPSSDFHFSLSHSKQFVACLVSRDTPVGLDIESPLPQRDVLALSSAAFTAAEHVWLAQQAETLRQTAFYRLWNSKEAWYKLMSAQGKPVDKLPSLIDADGKFQDSTTDWHSYTFTHAELYLATCSNRALASLELIDDVTADQMVCA